jgi:hypothetical protein
MSPDEKIKHALRLTFSYERSNVQLNAVQRVTMRPLPADPLQVPQNAAGFWVELRDAADRPLYRRVTQNPVRFAAEFPTGESDRPLAWGDLDEPRGAFVLVVPDLPAAQTVLLFSSPLGSEGSGKPASELVRFDLKQFLQKKEG